MDTMKPDLHTSLLCEDVRQEGNGKYIFIGNFDVMWFPQFPNVWGKMVIFNRWGGGVGEFLDEVRLMNPRNELVAGPTKVTVTLANTRASFRCTHNFVNTEFKEPGTYWFEVLLNGDLVRRYPLEVTLKKEDKA
jgi:hypothetical protein